MPILRNQRHEAFYVYVLIDPRTSDVFYVGKGKGQRAYSHVAEWQRGEVKNAEKFKRIGEIKRAGYEPVVSLISERISEVEALDLERNMIAIFGINNLTNVSKGEYSENAKVLVDIEEYLRRFPVFCDDAELYSNAVRNELTKEQRSQSYWDVVGGMMEIKWAIEGRSHLSFSPMFNQDRGTFSASSL